MKAKLSPFFGEVPACAENLEIVGPFIRRFEERECATVWPRSGIVRWKEGTIENETLWLANPCVETEQRTEHDLRNKLSGCGDFHSKWSWFPRKLRGRFFNLSLFWSYGYYHWICDVLGRLHDLLPQLTEEVKVILPPDLEPWHIRSLELVGLTQKQWVVYSGKRPLRVERLLYASPVAMTGDHEVRALHWVRDIIWRQCLGETFVSNSRRKLYLTRRNAGSRNVINESELVPILLQRGFEIIDCGKLSFDEQVRLFAGAGFVVAPHGAALTNILWSPKGVKVFELFDPTAVRRCYWSMCQALGHKYFCGIGCSVACESKEPIFVPIKEFILAIEKIDDE